MPPWKQRHGVFSGQRASGYHHLEFLRVQNFEELSITFKLPSFKIFCYVPKWTERDPSGQRPQEKFDLLYSEPILNDRHPF